MLQRPIALCGGTLFLAIVAATPVLADKLPPLKPGLWEMRTGPVASGFCIDAALSKKVMRLITGKGFLGKCLKREVQKTATGYIFEQQCKAADRVISGHIEVTGDFNSALTMTGEIDGKASPTIEIQWMGDCPEGWKPGDTALPDGRMMNLFDRPPK